MKVLLTQAFHDQGLRFERVEAAFVNGSTPLSAYTGLPCGGLVGWQLQGNQWRRCLIAPPALEGRGPQTRAAREEWAKRQHISWFDFAEERQHGNYSRGGHLDFYHYAPDFVYRWLKVPAVTVRDVRTLGVSVLHAANAYAASWSRARTGASPPAA